MKKIKSGYYEYEYHRIIKDNEPCSGTYRLWNVFEGSEWCIECSTLREAKQWIDQRGTRSLP